MMLEKELLFEVLSISELKSVAEKLIDFSGIERIITFKGNLGSGKTTFIKSIIEFLGFSGNVTSPTYSLVNEYPSNNPDLKALFHMDLYRLKSIEEALDFGILEYLDSGEYCFIEWPDIISPLLENRIEVCIEFDDSDKRIFKFERLVKNG